MPKTKVFSVYFRFERKLIFFLIDIEKYAKNLSKTVQIFKKYGWPEHLCLILGFSLLLRFDNL